ncbi:MAG TPA: histone deacetylase family protein, partial [Ignisphaera sp.]|nr:histone deacetylase family protein [Ignisphaera sp.]
VFALTRPPGHHVGRYGRAMGAPTQGFCIFNNIAGAIYYALSKKVKPILILDIDVHHGNGTQEIFWRNPDVIHIDIHEEGIYPGTGDIKDIGGDEARGTKINIPMPPLSQDEDYLYVLRELIIPLIDSIKPRIIVMSAGFDAYQHDGLASMMLSQEFYYRFGVAIANICKKYRGLLAVLEGGYTTGLRYGLPAFIKGFINYREVELRDIEIEPTKSVKNRVSEVMKILKSYHSL